MPSLSQAWATTYNVNITVDVRNITNGMIGELGLAVVDWNLVLSASQNVTATFLSGSPSTFDLTGPNSGFNSFAEVRGDFLGNTDLFAINKQLFFTFVSDIQGFFEISSGQCIS